MAFGRVLRVDDEFYQGMVELALISSVFVEIFDAFCVQEVMVG